MKKTASDAELTPDSKRTMGDIRSNRPVFIIIIGGLAVLSIIAAHVLTSDTVCANWAKQASPVTLLLLGVIGRLYNASSMPSPSSPGSALLPNTYLSESNHSKKIVRISIWPAQNDGPTVGTAGLLDLSESLTTCESEKPAASIAP